MTLPHQAHLSLPPRNFTGTDIHKLTVEEWKTTHQANGNNLQGHHGYSGICRIDFGPKLFRRHKEGYYILTILLSRKYCDC